MQSIHPVKEEAASTVISSVSVSLGIVWRCIVVGALLITAIGTWLIWFSAFAEQNLQDEIIWKVC